MIKLKVNSLFFTIVIFFFSTFSYGQEGKKINQKLLNNLEEKLLTLSNQEHDVLPAFGSRKYEGEDWYYKFVNDEREIGDYIAQIINDNNANQKLVSISIEMAENRFWKGKVNRNVDAAILKYINKFGDTESSRKEYSSSLSWAVGYFLERELSGKIDLKKWLFHPDQSMQYPILKLLKEENSEKSNSLIKEYLQAGPEIIMIENEDFKKLKNYIESKDEASQTPRNENITDDHPEINKGVKSNETTKKTEITETYIQAEPDSTKEGISWSWIIGGIVMLGVLFKVLNRS